MKSNKLLAMEIEYNILRARAIVETMELFEHTDISEIPDKYMKFYLIGEKTVKLHKEIEIEQKSINDFLLIR